MATSKKKTKKTAVKKVVKKVVKKAATKTLSRTAKKTTTKSSSGNLRSIDIKTITEKLVTITVTFTEVAAGNSNITATLNDQEKSLTSSGTIQFKNVNKDDIIGIDGTSPGKTKIEIDTSADPQEMNFTPGNFNDNFIIN